MRDDKTTRETSGAGLDPGVSKLLRMKRYETPPEGFCEEFLSEFRRRQRVEAMRPNLIERLIERAGDGLDSIRVPSYAYAAVVLFAISATAWILTSEEVGTTPAAVPSAAHAQAAGGEGETVKLQLHSRDIPEVLPVPVNIPAQRFVGTLPPQYLLESLPACKQEPFRF